MADVPGTIVSCYQLGEFIHGYISKAKDAPKEKQQYLDEVVAVIQTLKGLQRYLQVKPGESVPSAFENLVRPSITPTQSNDSVEQLSRREKWRSKLSLSTERKTSDDSIPLSDRVWNPTGQYESAGVLQRLEKTLAELKEKMQSDEGAMKVLVRMKWFWSDPEVKKKIETIMRLRQTIEYSLQQFDRDERAEQFIVTQETNRGVKSVNERLTKRDEDDERKAILNWLSPLQSLQRQSAIYQDTFPADQWVLDSVEFQWWSTGRLDSYLWFWGSEGAGKTVLSSQLTEHLKSTSSRDVLVLDLYLDYKESDLQTLESLLGSLLKQIIQHDGYGVRSARLKRLYQSCSDAEVKASASDISGILKEEFKRFSKVYMIIDGWNDISNSVRVDFQEQLRELSSSQNVHTLVTSRYAEGESAERVVHCMKCKTKDLKIYYFCEQCPSSEFCADCHAKGYSCGRTDRKRQSHPMVQPDEIYLSVKASDDEIQRYAEWELERALGKTTRRVNKRVGATRLDSTSLNDSIESKPWLKEQIPQAIARAAKGSYLEAKLQLQSIKDRSGQMEIEDALANLPEGIEAIYDETMKRYMKLKGKPGKRLMFTLYWVHKARRPLSWSEVQHAYDLEIDARNYEPEDPDDHPLKEANIIRDSAGNIKIDFDKSTVRLHSSMHEHLIEHADKYFLHNEEIDMAMRLLTCLNYDALTPFPEDEICEIEATTQELPLLSYACQFWPSHVLPLYTEPKIRDRLLRFLSNQDRVTAFQQISDTLPTSILEAFYVKKGLNGLHLAAYYGLDDLIPDLVKVYNIDSADPEHNQTALMYACRNGHLETVEKLLQFEPSINVRSRRGLTALCEYTGEFDDDDGEARGEITRSLLGVPNIDINSRNEQKLNRTILMLACYHDDNDLIELLLTREDLQVNLQDNEGNTALHIAILGYNQTAVQLLLAHPSIDLNATNHVESTALALAAADYQQPEVVDMLLDAGAEPSIVDRAGRTPLVRAVETGHSPTVDVFLQHNIPATTLSPTSRTLLHTAALHGHSSLIPILLAANIPLNARGSRGETALHEACRAGHLEAVRTLLDAGAEKETRDTAGRTPIEVTRQNAWKMSYNRILSLLNPALDAKGLPLEQVVAHADELPMWSLVRIGLYEQIEARIKTCPPSPALTVDSQTTLTPTDDGGLERLLDKDPDTGNTALHVAVLKPQRYKILTMLLDAGLSQAVRNDEGDTPLHVVAKAGDGPMVKALLGYLASAPVGTAAGGNVSDKATSATQTGSESPLVMMNTPGRTPLSATLAGGHFEVAVMLLDAGSPIFVPRNDSPTGDTAATKPPHPKALEEVYLNSLFFTAIAKGSVGTVEQLLKMGADDVSPGEDGRTAREVAADVGREDMEKLLEGWNG